MHDMHEDDGVAVRAHRRRRARSEMAHGETAAARHDRGSRHSTHPYTSASVPAIREALGEDWRPEAPQQDSWSSASQLEAPQPDRRPLHDPYRPAPITEPRHVSHRTSPTPGNPYSAAAWLHRAEPFNPKGGHEDDTPE
jgi:hypothetical protein